MRLGLLGVALMLGLGLGLLAEHLQLLSDLGGLMAERWIGFWRSQEGGMARVVLRRGRVGIHI